MPTSEVDSTSFLGFGARLPGRQAGEVGELVGAPGGVGFSTPLAAALAFDLARRKQGADFGGLNFPELGICASCGGFTSPQDDAPEVPGALLRSAEAESAGLTHWADEVLLCDGCDSEVHLACAGLSRVPLGDWFCRVCRARGGGGGGGGNEIGDKKSVAGLRAQVPPPSRVSTTSNALSQPAPLSPQTAGRTPRPVSAPAEIKWLGKRPVPTSKEWIAESDLPPPERACAVLPSPYLEGQEAPRPPAPPAFACETAPASSPFALFVAHSGEGLPSHWSVVQRARILSQRWLALGVLGQAAWHARMENKSDRSNAMAVAGDGFLME